MPNPLQYRVRIFLSPGPPGHPPTVSTALFHGPCQALNTFINTNTNNIITCNATPSRRISPGRDQWQT